LSDQELICSSDSLAQVKLQGPLDHTIACTVFVQAGLFLFELFLHSFHNTT